MGSWLPGCSAPFLLIGVFIVKLVVCQLFLPVQFALSNQDRWPAQVSLCNNPSKRNAKSIYWGNINALIRRLNYSHQPLVLSMTLILLLTAEQLLFSNLQDTQQVLSVPRMLKYFVHSRRDQSQASLSSSTHTHTPPQLISSAYSD